MKIPTPKSGRKT